MSDQSPKTAPRDGNQLPNNILLAPAESFETAMITVRMTVTRWELGKRLERQVDNNGVKT
ncbi:hypothetical protein GJ744_010680 [Endocarpon pusillum]|uniref:Uncharacterized protein n=1 Tax=Endocarpon pusillum TaxID=364733 RepID=A0A8H7AE04_9EURO|nr:hypothetical protein GJ744_010680 [Endocarpon pusillum]